MNKTFLFLVIVQGVFMTPMVSLAQQNRFYPFRDKDLNIEERIDNLLSLMTLDEKVKALGTNPEVPRLGVKGTGHVEGLHGLALWGPAEWADNKGIVTTIFPQAYGLGETWNPNLIKRIAEVEGKEARFAYQNYNIGGLVVRAPNADLARDPRWGRTEESYGEDPFLVSEMAKSFVEGLQGEDNRYWRTASLLKHFLANSNEDGRTYTSSNMDERLLHEYYALPFEKSVKQGGSRAFMAAYNKINGIPATVHPILKELTVRTWGQDGIICTDGGAFKLLLSDHHYFKDKFQAASAVIKAGVNQFLDDYSEAVYGALANGYLKESDFDEVLRGSFRVMIKLGLLDKESDNIYENIGRRGDTIKPWLRKDHQNLARRAVQESVVLLKNKDNFLPLEREELDTIALIGPYIDQVLLDWYSGTPPYTITLLEGIKNKIGSSTTVLTAKDNSDGRAATIAKKADVSIVVVGNHPTCEGIGWANCSNPSQGKEGIDRESLKLGLESLVKVVYEANPNTVVVLLSSFPYTINWTQEHVPAVVHLTHSAQELGNGLSDVLFGDYNPAGRLTQTWVKDITDLPDMMDYDIRNGRTYMYFEKEPLYAFGFGLSYSTFNYKSIFLDKPNMRERDSVKVSVDVENTSKRDGEEVVQLYVSYLNSSIKRPLRELKAFRRVRIPTGDLKKVELSLKTDDLKYWNTDLSRFQLEEGIIEIQVGSSSDDIRLRKRISVLK